MLAMLADIVWDKQTLAILMIFGIPIVGILAGTWYKVEAVRSSNNLKRKMIERGMSAAEIERVMKAGSPPSDD